MRAASATPAPSIRPGSSLDVCTRESVPRFPRLSVHEYSAILQGYALAHTAKVKRAFVQRFAAELNHDERE